MRLLSINESSAPSSKVLNAATRNATWLKSSGTDSRTKPLVRDGSASSSIVAGRQRRPRTGSGNQRTNRTGRQRTEELHQRLLTAQPHTMGGMRTETSAPMTIDIEPAIRLVHGKPLQEALKLLAASYRPIAVASLREAVERDALAAPLWHSFPVETNSLMGKVIGRRASMLSNDPEEKEEAMRRWMLQRARFYPGRTYQ
jgi:hypothetical protein